MKRVAISCWPDTKLGRSVHEINESFARQIEKAGALPFLVPILDTNADLTPYIEEMDGLLLIGGADVASFEYGEDPHESAEAYQFKRDAHERRFFMEAYRAGKKIIGVCRGMHMINIALGGSLWQHLPELEGGVMHGGFIPNVKIPYHRIQTTGGRMQELYPGGLIVNSFHHQGLKIVARELTVTATSFDGLPEAVENDQILAVQFHPEFEEINADTAALYRRFVEEL